MINGFHMNPLWYLATIPSIIFYMGLLGLSIILVELIIGFDIGLYTLVITSTILLLLLMLLAATNIIGIADAIAIWFILSLTYLPGIGPTAALSLIITVPIAILISHTYQSK